MMNQIQKRILEKLYLLASLFFTLDLWSGTVHLSSLFFVSLASFYGNFSLTRGNLGKPKMPKKKKEISFSKKKLMTWKKK